MNPLRLITAIACLAACAAMPMQAQQGSGTASGLQQGMVFKGYTLGKQHFNGIRKLDELAVKLPTLPAVKTMVDKDTCFSLRQLGKKTAVNSGKWEGLLNCKRAGCYTFVITQAQPRSIFKSGAFTLRVNDACVLPEGRVQASVDVNLNLGLNKIDLFCLFRKAGPVSITYKPKDSLSEPRQLTPGTLSFKPKAEQDW